MSKILSNWYKGDVCQAPGITPTGSELISVGDIHEEELHQGEGEEEEEELDLDVAYDELEANKQRLIQLRAKLLTPSSESCVLEEQEDNGSLRGRRVLLQQLRRRNFALRCQLQQQMQELRAGRKDLLLLEAQRCQLAERLRKMSDELENFAQFKLSAQHQFGLCIERNELIKASKIDKMDFFQVLQDLFVQSQGRMSKQVTNHCHEHQRYAFSLELVLIRIFLHALFGNLIHNF